MNYPPDEACNVKNVATRKYLDQGHLWYFPPVDMFVKMVEYANLHGKADGKPYFSVDGEFPLTAGEWSKMRSTFNCPMGFTNVWNRKPLAGKERIKAPKFNSKAAHLNQKPLDLMKLIIETSSEPGDVVWEPFGGLFSASLAAKELGRVSYSAEVVPAIYNLGKNRFI